MKYRNAQHTRRGMTTVELLVVMAIIGVILSVSIPMMVRAGLFGGQKAELGGREFFTMLRAARLYATTYNTSTALVYGVDMVRDSLTDVDVPIADSYALVRRVRQSEVIEGSALSNALAANGLNVSSDRIYVPIASAEGSFKRFANDTCVLQDLFTVSQSGRTLMGLNDILVWDLNGSFFYEPRIDYNPPGAAYDNSFPAHEFLPSGALHPGRTFDRQRFTLRVGLRPDADPVDRYITDPDAAVAAGTASIKFTDIAVDQNNRITIPVYKQGSDPGDRYADELDVDLDIELYVSSGRVKVAS